MQTEDQNAFIAFLERAESGVPRRIDTHISTVILHTDRAFKLKRAVKFTYLDFSTAPLRLAACRTEFELNRRTAPQLYLGVRQIMRAQDGALSFDGPGELVDAIVDMRRFEQHDLFDVMAQEGRLATPLLTRLARHIARFHDSLAPDLSTGGAESLGSALAANEGGFAAVAGLNADSVSMLLSKCRAQFEEFRPVLDARGRAGRVRRCHGDLHLRNICLYQGEPVLFDCLEFDERLATTDVLYDFAFLLMDLVHRNLRDEANLVFNRYIDATGDDTALALMPFFMAVRACVRAHVGAAAANGNAEKLREAQAYADLALELLEENSPRLIAIGGLSGSGKSSVAAQLASRIGAAPGARILSTDRIRKALAGIAAEQALPAQSYTQQSSDLVYAKQRAQAARVLAGRWSVIADAVFLKMQERDAIAADASQFHAPFAGLWLQASADILMERVAARVNDPSDATVAVLKAQLARDPGAGTWRAVDASGSLEQSTAAALQIISGFSNSP